MPHTIDITDGIPVDFDVNQTAGGGVITITANASQAGILIPNEPLLVVTSDFGAKFRLSPQFVKGGVGIQVNFVLISSTGGDTASIQPSQSGTPVGSPIPLTMTSSPEGILLV